MTSGAHFPNGVSTQTTSAQNTQAGAGDLDCNKIYTSVFPDVADVTTRSFKVAYAPIGSASTIALTSALYNSSAICLAPFKCVPEIIYAQGATAAITVSVRVNAGSVSTATDIATLTVSSGTTLANTAYSVIGGTALAAGAEIHITSAVQATVNSSNLFINLIPVA